MASLVTKDLELIQTPIEAIIEDAKSGKLIGRTFRFLVGDRSHFYKSHRIRIIASTIQSYELQEREEDEIVLVLSIHPEHTKTIVYSSKLKMWLIFNKGCSDFLSIDRGQFPKSGSEGKFSLC